MKHKEFLLQIIDEEINRFLFVEQAPPPQTPPPPAPPAAPATPPAAPDASAADPTEEDDETDAPTEDEDKGEGDSNDIEDEIKALAVKTPVDIKKTLLSALQNGAEQEDTEELVAYVQSKDDKASDTESSVPSNVKKAVTHIVKTFNFKVPERAEKKAEELAESFVAPTTAESRLQTSLREYLLFKQLSQKVRKR